MYRFRKAILLSWLITAIVLGIFAFKLPSALHGSGFETEGTYAEVEKILKNDFNVPAHTMLLVFEKKTSETSDEQLKTSMNNTLERLTELEGFSMISSSFETGEGIKQNAAYAAISFDENGQKSAQNIEKVRNKLANDEFINISLTGGPVIEEDMNMASQHDLKRAELIGLPIALIVLLFAFGGLVAAVIPLFIGIISVVSTMGLLYFISSSLNLSIFVLNVVPMVGLALGIDFALLFINRFREELETKTTQNAVVITVQTAGRSIIFSGLCVFLGLAGMLLIDIDIFKTVAIGGMFVVVLSVVTAITFLPALLGIIGKTINQLMILKQNTSKVSPWHRFAKFVMKRPVLMALSAFVLLMIGILPVKDMNVTIPEADALPKSYESRTAFDTYKKAFMEKNTTKVPIIVNTNANFLEKDTLQHLEKLTEELSADPLVSKVDSVFSLSNLNADSFWELYHNESSKQQFLPLIEALTTDKKMLLTVYLDADHMSNRTQNWVKDWNGNYNNFTLQVGGQAKFNQEIFDEVYQKIGYVLLLVLSSTYVILLLAFRSVLIPLKAILMNIMSLSATFGIVVWLFQGGHFGIEPTSIALMIPIFTFGIVFGLSMDYEVFLISRIHEVYQQTKDNDKATLEGLTSTSKIISSAAAIMIVITGAFAFTGVVPVKQMGIAIALSIFIDATIVRMVLVPSLMKLLGDWNWWAPSFLRFKDEKKIFQHG
ncbi:MMPL family transporter [Bacillus taeanensis]|uniref:MMPL family transporter n=2 Tax=Bacillus taeanensis TaxID=273032 RepID=A0A366XY19_9BACI|nr:MMPL family transporter [Bacillus taeanensis]RBW69043.1 MMPL family transporter [Bacillus taeanensis]